MKRIIAITSLLTFFAFANAQEPLSKVANIKAPIGAEIKSKDAIFVYEKQNFKHVASIERLTHIYKLGGVLIAFEDFGHSKGYDSTLEDRRARMLGEVEEIQAAGTNDKVDILPFNGTKYLIRRQNKGDEFYYYFTSEDINKKGIMGSVKFKSTDKEKAEKILYDFLNNIKF